MKLFNKKKQKKDNNQSKKHIFTIEEAFKQNLKYISQTEINVEDIEKQFVKSNTRFFLTVGEIDCPTGKIVVSDPLCYLASGEYCPTLEEKIPKGKYKVEVAICRNEYIGIRMCTSRLKIKDTKAVKYVCAKPSKDNNASKENIYTGFPVEAGMMSFCDEQVADEYRRFLDKWHQENKDKNHYDDYFVDFFKQSEQNLPAYQREEGDFIEWTNPNTKNRLVMIASGLGDGFYQSYWGYDKNEEICELIVPMVNPDIFENKGE